MFGAFGRWIAGLLKAEAPDAAAAGDPAARAARRRLYALVQTKPRVVVLAISDSREDLEAEVAELNETWNHWDLRTERQRYDIQPVCMLQTAKDDRLGLNRVSHDPAVGGQ